MAEQGFLKGKRASAQLPVAPTALRPEQAAQCVGLSLPTLARMRVDGIGPVWFHLGKKAIAYSIEELDTWLASRPRFRSTTQRDLGVTAA